MELSPDEPNEPSKYKQSEKPYIVMVHTTVRKMMVVSARSTLEARALANLDIARRYTDRILDAWLDGIEVPVYIKKGDKIVIKEEVVKVTPDTRARSLRLETANRTIWDKMASDAERTEGT